MSSYRYKLLIEYDGTDYAGWQIQPELKTVQAEIQTRLRSLFKEDIKFIGSGRTDSGVHAAGQVGAFSSSYMIDCKQLIYRLNRMLPDDIAILKASLTRSDFDPRRDASSRIYRYSIAESPAVRDRHYRYRLNRPLDLDRLNRAAMLFLGRHDFAAFCKLKSQKKNNECEVYQSHWYRYRRAVIYQVEANRFLHNMVRRLVGVMLDYEQQKINLTHIRKFLNNNDMVKFTVPANGLILKEVKYGRIAR